jgi:iron complex outermembrane recepter protein
VCDILLEVGGQRCLRVDPLRDRSVEVDVNAALGELEFVGSYTYADARNSASSDLADPYLDKRLASIPEHSASLWATQGFGAFGVEGFRAGAGVRYVGKTWDGLDTLATPSNTLVDAMFSMDVGWWRYALNATNLFDETYLATCLDRGDCWFGSRRNVSVKATYHF